MSSEREPRDASPAFAETALKLAGKSEDEARRTGAIDRADDQVESLFAPQYQTTASPIHRAIWEPTLPIELFTSAEPAVAADVQRVMDQSRATVERHRAAGTLHNAEKKLSTALLDDLGRAGYWGLLVDRRYGGSGAPFAAFARFLTQMATVDPTVAGMASVHGCIGAVDPLRTFGSAEQKQRWLPLLASGQRLSAFALTEPGAGSDLTALRTRAVRVGDAWVVDGEKLFITNVVPGRTIGLVCLIENRPSVLIVDLPESESEQFQFVRYGLHALKHTYNQGLRFRGFRVPLENRLEPTKGDGLTIAYHGLNLGRVALCATAAGSMRLMLADMLPWARFRRTYGEPIARRELVRRRLGRLAGLIVACDALVAWCSTLLDRGFRGEMECIIAKIFGSEAQKEAAIELHMKTHGGRAFLHGHLFGDHVHEFLAPCIYEGEGEMLGMAFFKSLVKQHGTQYFEPIGKALATAGVRRPNLLNPLHAWALRAPLAKYAGWLVNETLRGHRASGLPALPAPLDAHAARAIALLSRAAREISATMRKHQLALADRQCRMAELSLRIQRTIVVLVTSLYAGRSDDPIVRAAGDVACQELLRELSGARPADRYFRAVTRLGEQIVDGGWRSLVASDAGEVLMPYDQPA